MAKSAYSKFDPAKDFGLKSLYCNDATLYDKAKIDVKSSFILQSL